MSRENLPILALDSETWTGHETGTAINSDTAFEIDARGDTSKLLIRIDHTTNAEKVVTILAPTANPHAPRAPLGNLAVTMAAGDATVQKHAVVIESARFAQADGMIHLSAAADTTGWITVYRLPRGA